MKAHEVESGVGPDSEFAERLASVTEELEDLVNISTGKKTGVAPIVSRIDLLSAFKQEKTAAALPKSLLSVFRLLVVKNLIRGKLFATAYSSGKEIGLNTTLRTRQDFIKVTRRFGLGTVRIIKFDPDHVKIRLPHGITATGIKKAQRPICYFEAGIFAGFLERIFRKTCNVRETKCRAMGSPYCQFELTKYELKDGAGDSPYTVDAHAQHNLKLLTSLATHSINAIENAILFEKTRQQVVVDGLTLVYNHRYFQTRFDVEFKRAQRYKFPLTLFMMDIDNFKSFNDKFGHPTGDEVLKSVAAALVKNVRAVDVVARYGGDEFALILPQTDGEAAKVIAQRIRKEIARKKIPVKRRKIPVTISLGSLTLEPKELKGRASTMIEVADKALLRAKKKGKNALILVKKT